MSKKQLWWATAALAVTVAVGGAAATGVSVQRAYRHLDHGAPFELPAPQPALEPAEPGPADAAATAAALDAVAAEDSVRDALATFGAQVIDTTSGEVIWERVAGRELIPASSTKVLTAAAATLALDENQRLHTQVVRGANPGEVVIRAAGDVWITAEQLDQAAEDIAAASPEGVSSVIIDTSVWTGPEQGAKWDPTNVDAGFVAPMQPAMIAGGRLGGMEGDLPRSHTPALDVASALAARLGAGTVGMGPAPEGAAVITELASPTLAERMDDMMKHSDNVMAEAIAREVAVARGTEASFAGATAATLEVLREHGVELGNTQLKDNSGLSEENRIAPATLAGIVSRAVTEEPLRPVLTYLPVAGGEGTLYTRYADLDGRGFVRAKTGTLTGVSALAGTAQGQSGRIYAFAFLVNDGEVTIARAAQDRLASVLHEF